MFRIDLSRGKVGNWLLGIGDQVLGIRGQLLEIRKHIAQRENQKHNNIPAYTYLGVQGAETPLRFPLAGRKGGKK
ncbi:hypothetical protein SE18_10455 [Herpetosiphon geysericola]|uniref:Uncharacterized protein n=1 Tax=Herpetosiphon geysericola TaxID=70996 RepID=A0A0P6XWQ1_9CHLR|nr:hypothetical protein SE18_10455 [Herpetosiphon geysericola]